MQDSDIALLRATVATLDREIGLLPPPASPNELVPSWRALVEQLDLGPPPVYRECPACGQRGRPDASVCGFCWTKLAPLAAE
ncbi:MAG: hypothetical protein ABMA64_07440 [Myxococcota bacterium]